jgi:hypothetical protein
MSLGLWVASRLLSGSFHDTSATTSTFVVAGLLLSIVNTVLRPIIVILSSKGYKACAIDQLCELRIKRADNEIPTRVL